MYAIEIHKDQQADNTYYTFSVDSVFYQHQEMPTTKGGAMTLAKAKVKELKANKKKYGK